MENKKYNPLDLEKLKNKKRTSISMEESLEDIVPINWSKEVLEGKRKITVTNFK